MSLAIFLGVAIAGGLGAGTRYLVDQAIRRPGQVFPISTFIINVTGSLALGIVAGLALSGLAPDWLRPVLGTGFLGGYTTFSTAAVEAVRLSTSGHHNQSMVYLWGSLIASTLAAWIGLLVAM